MNHNPHSDIMTAVLIGGDLQLQSIKVDTVVGADSTFMMFAENIIEIFSSPGNEQRAFLRSELHKLRVVRRHIDLDQIAVGSIHLGDSVQSQLFDKSILVGFKSTFTATPGLWR